jgi:hypothetical protein
MLQSMVDPRVVHSPETERTHALYAADGSAGSPDRDGLDARAAPRTEIG